MLKTYVMGKFIDPELRETNNKQTFVRFSVYANHEAVVFDVYEKQTRKINGVDTLVDDPRFQRVAEIKDGTSVIVSVNPVYSERSKSVRYFVQDIYPVEPAAGKVLNSVFARQPVGEVE